MPCIDAITPRRANRGTSAGWRCCACSMRQRRFGGIAVARERLLVDVEHLAVGAIADGVHRELVAVAHRELGPAADLLDRLEHEAAAARQVGVGLEQPGAVRAERAVDLTLDRAHHQVVVGPGGRAVGGEPPIEVSGASRSRRTHHHVEPHRQRALVLESAQEVDGREARARVLEAGDAVAQRLLAGEAHLEAQLAIDLRRRCAPIALARARRPPDPARSRAGDPVSSPAASRTSSPPGGSALDRSSPASASARALANAAWPQACVSRTGFSGLDGGERRVHRVAFDRGRAAAPSHFS